MIHLRQDLTIQLANHLRWQVQCLRELIEPCPFHHILASFDAGWHSRQLSHSRKLMNRPFNV